MRWLLVLWLASSAATAAELKGRVVSKEGVVAKAQVRVFAQRRSLDGCAGPGVFGSCLCPDKQEAFGARLLAGFTPPEPLASATSAADGAFNVQVSAPGPWTAIAISADGSLIARGQLNEEGGDLVLAEAQTFKVRLEGVTAGAVAWLFDSETLAGTALTRQANGDWSSGPMPQGLAYLFIVAPGAQVAMQLTLGGRLMHMMTMPVMNTVPTVTLAPPQLLDGLVIDEKGRPVGNVEVIAEPDGCAVKTKTNAKGEFTLPAVAAAPYQTSLLARSPGKVARAHGEGGAKVELSLRPAARLELTFVDKRGAPAEGVEGHLSGQHAPGGNEKSDAAGRWTQADLYEEDVQLRVMSPWVLVGDRTLSVKGTTKRKLVVEKGVALSGRVVDAKGVPVPGVYMSVFFGDAMQKQATTGMKDALRDIGGPTDARGEFSFSVLPGDYEVVAKRGQIGESSALGTAPGRVEVKLVPTSLLEGLVVDAAGKPIAAANVRAQRIDVPNRSYGATSNAQGRFEIAVSGPGTFDVSVSRASGGPDKKLVVELGSTGAKPVKVTLEAVAVVRGVVVDPAGKPIANVLVEAMPSSSPHLMMMRAYPKNAIDLPSLVGQARMMNLYAQATTAADGTFELPWAHEAIIFVQSAGRGAEPVTGKPGTLAKIVLAPRSSVRGRVVDFTGKPVGRFTLNGQPVRDPEGKFEVTLPATGSLALRFVADPAPVEDRTVEVPAAVGAVELGEVKLKQGFVVSGTVVAAETGKPVRHPYIDAKSTGGTITATAVQQDGSFVYRGVPEGVLEVKVTHSDYAAAAVTAKAGDRNVAIKLQKFATLTVTVLRAREPAANVNLKLSGPEIGGEKNTRVGRTNADGIFKLDAAQPGPWTVEVVDSASKAAPSKKLKLVPGQQGTVELTVP